MTVFTDCGLSRTIVRGRPAPTGRGWRPSRGVTPSGSPLAAAEMSTAAVPAGTSTAGEALDGGAA